ncbi:hypothetical protein CTAYLR_000260 [Chrysophaeum taylorii]|uniref:C2 domain-containing protein n=1 Tax=Chrysophaeum taylorii TaxID=2483200 RepID=A0AAD7UFS8_9STRA|nr:hypothetical protein CTAYLR_000260 [Chrysophaeum taylorii]
MADIEDRLEVKVVAARNLLEVEGGECNPFAVVRCGGEIEQTTVLNHTTDPEWNSARMVFSDITENETDHVVVTVMHKDLSAQQDQTIGAAIVDLRTAVLSPGIETDEWYELERAPGMGVAASGQVRIEATYFLNEGEDALPDEEEGEVEEEASRLPNMLVGTVARARGLYLEGKDLLDAYASVRVLGGTIVKASTPVQRRNNSPHWDFGFKLPVSEGERQILVKVKDRGVLRNRVIGTCTIPMVEVAAHGDAGLMKWCKLLGEDGMVDGKDRGDLEIQLKWTYDKKYAKSIASRIALATSGVMSRKSQKAKDEQMVVEKKKDEWLVEEEAFVPLKLSVKEQEAVRERRQAQITMADRQLDDLERAKEHEMVGGDYQIQVHILEARDLNAEDLNGLSDPYARVKVLNRTKKTRVIRKVSSCVFDETLYFNANNVSQKEIEEAVVEVQVYDFDAFTAHDMIGVATFDARAVHALPDHEFYRKWVGLVDTRSSEDNGYQGFLKLSITVLGPGDQQKAHDVEREYQEETAAELEAEGPSALGGLSLSGPSLDSKLVFLVVYVWEAEDLPKMDVGLFAGGGIEAYVKCEFAGNSVVTSAVHVKGKGNLAPEYREELWLPVVEPVESKRVTVGLWDYNTFSRDNPVAHLYFDYAEVKRTDSSSSSSSSYFASLVGGGPKYTGPRPQWHNLYGAPLGVQGKRGALQNVFGGSEASTYRGRLLLSMEVLTKPPSKEKQVAHRAPFHFKPAAGLKPAAVKYHFRVLAISGSEIPTFRSPGGLGAAKMQLIVSIGNHALEFAFEPNKKGIVMWNDLKQLKGIDLPVMLEEIPDVCVYLVRGPPKVQTVCYARLPAAKFLKEQFRGDPTWVVLKADKARTKAMGGVALTVNPGAVLVKFGLGLSEDAIDPAFSWDEVALRKKAEDPVPYALRVYVFQARDLPASDENGLLDPYVKVRFCGNKAKTKVHSMTTAPLFYETLQFHELVPRDLKYGPDVVVQVWDRDALGSNTPMAMLRYPLSKCVVLASESSKHPVPEWHALRDINGEPIAGELLFSAALIRKRDASEKFNRPDDITPQMRRAWVEVLCVGVRQLKTYRLRTPQEPYVRVDVPAPKDGGDFFATKPSRRPSGRNANFVERKICCVEMPENALYAQRMDVRVYDSRVGLTTGLAAPLLGATSVDLSKKMSWNADGYVPPQNDLFDDAEARKREEERQKAEARRRAADRGDDGDSVSSSSSSSSGGGGGGGASSERRGRKIFFGDDDDDDQDLERREEEAEEDALLYADAEERPQHELERYAKPPIGVTEEDAGIGAFDPMVVDELPMIYEDVLYQEEQERQAATLLQEEEEKKAGGRSLIDIVEARLADATDVGQYVGEEDTFKLSELDISFPSQWAAADFLEGREWWTQDQNGSELEAYLKTKPFESYPVYRGRYHPDPSKSTRREVGVFKAIIRVLDQDPLTATETIPLELLREARYAVRVYAIRGQNLQPVDGNSCDPYLRLKLGSEVETRERKDRTLKPDFYDYFEFHTTLPGPSVLKIQVKDWNRFAFHELVGETKIDLEDRWYHPEWQKLGEIVPPPRDAYNKLKPIEVRNLRKETSSVVQGQLHLWLEIRPDFEARRDPPVPFEGPEKKKFEVRVVCWKSLQVPYEMGDYYAEFWIGDSRKQKTDIHWRCRNGKASWNWRIKIPVVLPLDSPEKGRLNVQLWDQDIIKWNDVIGDAQIDLYRWFLKAYHEKRSVNMFKLINDAKETKKRRELGVAEDDDLLEEDEDDGEDLGEEEEEEGEEDDDQENATDNPLLENAAAGGANDDIEAPEPRPDDIDDDELKKEDDDDKEPLLGGGGKKNGRKKKKKKEEEEEEEDQKPDPNAVAEKDAQYFVKQLKELVGLGDIDESASWIKLTYLDRKRNKLHDRGRIAITVEILPEDEAEVRPAGHGRSEPNSNPYLPPTTGRMSFSWNPFYLCSALLGPKLAFQIACVCCCIVMLVVLGFLGMYFSSFYILLESLGLAGADDDTDDFRRFR